MVQGRRGFGRLRRERSGRYSAAYVGPDLRLHRAPETFKATIDAEGWLAAERRQIDLDQWVPPQRRHPRLTPEADPTVGSCAMAWLADRRQRDPHDPMALQPSSVKDYQPLLNNHVLPKLGAVRLAELDASDIEAWYRALSSRKTPRARAEAYSLLGTILNSAKNNPHAPLTEDPAHQGSRPRAQIDADPSGDPGRAAGDHAGDARQAEARGPAGGWCALR